MNCPSCGITLCLCYSCRNIDNALTDNKDVELFICKGCKLTRPVSWWEVLELDIETEINWESSEVVEKEEELTGYCESPWSD